MLSPKCCSLVSDGIGHLHVVEGKCEQQKMCVFRGSSIEVKMQTHTETYSSISIHSNRILKRVEELNKERERRKAKSDGVSSTQTYLDTAAAAIRLPTSHANDEK